MGKNKLPDMNKYARKFGKHDSERLGIFIEMPYMPARGKPAKPAKDKKKEEEEEPLRTMLPGGPKTKCGNMDGYFDDEFPRLFKGEGPGKPPKLKAKGKKEESATPFMPTGPTKKHATPGDYFGCFNEPFTEFSPKVRKVPKYKPPPPNFVTNPSKKGGPGYINITIGKYPDYKGGRPRKEQPPKKRLAGPLVTVHFPKPYFYPNPYRDPLKDPPTKKMYNEPRDTTKIDKKLAGRPTFMPNGPAKWDGGCKGGTFSKYPVWTKDTYLTPLQKEQALAGKEIPFLSGEFVPISWGDKTMFTTSTLYNTHFSMNGTNWKDYEPKYVKRLVTKIY